jgi:FMN phosphatase YigB (HAD superfamily)
MYLKHRFGDIELYPDVIPVLNSLHGKFCLGLLSNGNGYPVAGFTDTIQESIQQGHLAAVFSPNPSQIALERSSKL